MKPVLLLSALLALGLAPRASASAFVDALQARPVEWRAWSESLGEESRSSGKPLFFFLGHFGNGLARAMSQETFANQTIAQVVNETTLPILVDVNDEPELAALIGQLASEHFGASDWPVCLWTTADLAPLAGGGYFPPTDDWGGQGFLTLARNTAEQWTHRREEVEPAAQARLQDTLDTAAFGPSANRLSQAVEAILQRAEEAQSLRPAEFLALSQALPLLSETQRQSLAEALSQRIELIVRHAGFDSIDGGFFVGANDPEWKLPLFQKSTADQASMMAALASLSENEIASDISADLIRLTDSFVQSRLLKKNGLILQYLDSFAPGESMSDLEGSYYLFGSADLQGLDDEATSAWSLASSGNVDAAVDVLGLYEGLNIPYNAAADIFSAALDPARLALREIREGKREPAADTVAYLATNAALVSAYIQAAKATSDEIYVERALRLHGAMKQVLRQGDEWLNDDRSGESARPQARALLTLALLDLHESTQQAAFLDEALALVGDAPPAAGLPQAPGRDRWVEAGIEWVDQLDRRLPSAAATQAQALRRLSEATEDTRHRDQARALLDRTFKSVLENPESSLSLHLAAKQLDQ